MIVTSGTAKAQPWISINAINLIRYQFSQITDKVKPFVTVMTT